MLGQKTLLGLLVYGLVGVGLYQSYGHYHPYYVPFVFLALVGLVAISVARPETSALLPRGRLELLLATLVLAFSAMLAYEPLLRFASGPRWAVNTLLHVGEATVVPLAVGTGWLWWKLRRGDADVLDRPALAAVFGVAAVALLFNQCLVSVASPSPQIDVYRHSLVAVDFLLHGQDPYRGNYPELYGGISETVLRHTYPYWPGSIVLFALARAAFGEIRLALVASQAVSAVALYLLARRMGLPRVTRVLFPLAWLSFPAQYFVIEQAWVDTFLTTCVLVVTASLRSRRWVVAALVAGLAACVKQYGVVLAVAVPLWLWRTRSLREALEFAAVSAGAFLAVVVPFVVWDPKEFLFSTVQQVGRIEFRPDSFTLASYLFNEWDVSLSVTLLTALSGLGGLLGLGLLLPRRLAGWGVFQVPLALLASFTALFFLGRHAYCNYIHLLAFLVLLFVVGSLPDKSIEPGPAPTASAAAPQA
ncbi:MAG: glycosyltransferase 87 family protein [Myxococcales bacterium]